MKDKDTYSKQKIRRVKVFNLEPVEVGNGKKGYHEIEQCQGEFVNYKTAFTKFRGETVLMLLAVVKMDNGKIITTPATMINFIDKEES